MNVLVVEDHEESRRAMTRLLLSEGMHVQQAGTLADAMTQRHGQDLILLDLNLPDGDGTELLASVRATQTTVVLVCTGTFDSALLCQARALGPDGVMFKPLDPTAVLTWIKVQVGSV